MSNSYKQRILLMTTRQPQNNGADLDAVPVTRPSGLPVVPEGRSRRRWLRTTVQGVVMSLHAPADPNTPSLFPWLP